MSRYIDITGKRFGRLVAIRADHTKYTKSRFYEFWLCQCDCGNKKIVSKPTLVAGITVSCGCYKREIHTKHGKSSHRLHHIWKAMISRCENEKRKSYKNYGGRGIKVCEEWHDMNNFFNWAITHGYSDDLTIDRENNDGDYCSENCRWVTMKVQNNNRRGNRIITYNGETRTLMQWSEILGVTYALLRSRLCRGWPVEKAFTTPENSSHIMIEYNGERKNISQWSRATGIDEVTIKKRYDKGLSVEKIFEKQKSNTGYKGVYFHSKYKKYRARISINKKRIHLGNFNTAEEAYKAYCEAEKEQHGELDMLA